MRGAVWRTTLRNKGSNEKPKWEHDDWPRKCEDCDEFTQERHGCGFKVSTRGKGTVQIASGATLLDCPQWLAQQPYVWSVYEFLSDYEENRLGNVFHLPAALVDCLRAVSSELATWKGVQNEKVYTR